MPTNSQNERADLAAAEIKDKNGKVIREGYHVRLSEAGRQNLLDAREQDTGMPPTTEELNYCVSYRGIVKNVESDGIMTVVPEGVDQPEPHQIHKFMPEDLIVEQY